MADGVQAARTVQPDDTGDTVLTRLLAEADAAGELDRALLDWALLDWALVDRAVSGDSTVVRGPVSVPV